MASQTLNLDSVPVVKAENLTDEQKQALVIADNKIASNSTWTKIYCGIKLENLMKRALI